MNKDHSVQLLEKLNCRKIKFIGDEIYSTCPFESNHKKGIDKRPSFYAKTSSDSISPYFCHACHESGTLEFLARSKGYSELCESILIGENDDWNRFKKPNREEEKSIPEFLLDKFSGVVHNSVLNRDINLHTVKVWEIGYDAFNMRTTLPVRKRDGALVGLSGRSVVDHKIKYAHYSWDTRDNILRPWIDHSREDDFVRFEKGRYLFGEHLIKNKELVITEGHFDAIKVWSAGFSAVAIMGSYPTMDQMKKIISYSEKVYAMFDNDDHGNDCRKRLQNTVGGFIPVFWAKIKEGKKDPGDMTKTEIEESISNAEIILD